MRSKLDKGIQGKRLHDVFVRMGDQLFVTAADYPKFCNANAKKKRGDLRTLVLKTLHEKADTSWEQIEPLVVKQREAGNIEAVERYFIINGFACRANTEACETLAADPRVAFIYRKPQARLLSLAKSIPRDRPNPSADKQTLSAVIDMWEQGAKRSFDPKVVTTPWNLRRIQADQVWRKEAVTGKGITIALLDTGVYETPALIHALWRNPGEELNGKDDDGNGYVDDLFGWNFRSNSPVVFGGRQGHGTMCGGILAGRPVRSDEKTIVTGIAPEARLMVLKGMGSIKAYEYALTNGADVLSMSYMWVNVPLGNWRGLYRLAHEHMTAAGIISVGGAGNFAKRAPAGRQICLPKDIPCVVAAAGLNKAMEKASASSEGPCTWDDVVFYKDYAKEAPLNKPDVTGFFTDYPVWMRLPLPKGRRRMSVVHKTGAGYALVIGPGGNSFSGPHAGGVAALMLSADRDLPAWTVIDLMKKTCMDLGKKGHDHVFGAGLLQALDAVRAVKALER